MFVKPAMHQVVQSSFSAVNHLCRLGIAGVVNACCYPLLSQWIDHIEPRLQKLSESKAFVRKVLIFSVGTLLLNLAQLKLLFGNRLGNVAYLALTVSITAGMTLSYCLLKRGALPPRGQQTPVSPSQSITPPQSITPRQSITPPQTTTPSSSLPEAPVRPEAFGTSLPLGMFEQSSRHEAFGGPFISDDVDIEFLEAQFSQLSPDRSTSLPETPVHRSTETRQPSPTLPPSATVPAPIVTTRSPALQTPSAAPQRIKSLYSPARFKQNGGRPLQLTIVPVVKVVKEGFLTEEQYQNLERNLSCSRATINYFLTGLKLSSDALKNEDIYNVLNRQSAAIAGFLRSCEGSLSSDQKMEKYVEYCLITVRSSTNTHFSGGVPPTLLQMRIDSSLNESGRNYLSRIMSGDCSSLYSLDRYENLFSEEELIDFVNYFVKDPTFSETHLILGLLGHAARIITAHRKIENDKPYAQFASRVPQDNELGARIMNKIKQEFFIRLPKGSLESGLTLMEFRQIQESITKDLGLLQKSSDVFIGSIQE